MGKLSARYNELSSGPTNTLYLVSLDIRFVLGYKLLVLNSLQEEQKLIENYQLGKLSVRYNELSSGPRNSLYLIPCDIW